MLLPRGFGLPSAGAARRLTSSASLPHHFRSGGCAIAGIEMGVERVIALNAPPVFTDANKPSSLRPPAGLLLDDLLGAETTSSCSCCYMQAGGAPGIFAYNDEQTRQMTTETTADGDVVLGTPVASPVS